MLIFAPRLVRRVWQIVFHERDLRPEYVVSLRMHGAFEVDAARWNHHEEGLVESALRLAVRIERFTVGFAERTVFHRITPFAAMAATKESILEKSLLTGFFGSTVFDLNQFVDESDVEYTHRSNPVTVEQ